MSWQDDESEFSSMFGGDQYLGNPFLSKLFGLESDQGMDPNSPEAQAYLAKSKEPPPSAAMFSTYIHSKPDEEEARFKPSIGRRIAAGLVGGGMGLLGKPEEGITLGRKIALHPYEKALEDWKTEGLDLSTRARLADAAASRELGAQREVIRGGERRTRESNLEAARVERLNQAADKEKRIEEQTNLENKRKAGIDERSVAASERANALLAVTQGREGRIERGQQRTLEQKRAINAKDKAHEFVKNQNPEFFTNPNNPDDHSLRPDLGPEERDRAINLIQQQEDVYRRMYGLVPQSSPNP